MQLKKGDEQQMEQALQGEQAWTEAFVGIYCNCFDYTVHGIFSTIVTKHACHHARTRTPQLRLKAIEYAEPHQCVRCSSK